jgi:hypothetical protein
MIIGAQKAGTTALYAYLNQHPQNVKEMNEIHFYDVNYDKGMEWYKEKIPQKPDSSYIFGDKGPDYMLHPTIAERVYNDFPNIKLIVVLRNPVDRSYSQFWFNKRRDREPLDTFEEAIANESELIFGEIEKQIADPFYVSWRHRRSGYLARSRYVEQLARWLEFYDREQLLVVDANNLRADPQNTMNEVFAFLGLDSFTVSTENGEKNSDYPPMDPEMRKTLLEYFKPYNANLEELLGQKFNWD